MVSKLDKAKQESFIHYQYIQSMRELHYPQSRPFLFTPTRKTEAEAAEPHGTPPVG